MKMYKIISLIPSLGYFNSPIGTVLEVDEKTLKRCIDNGEARLYDVNENIIYEVTEEVKEKYTRAKLNDMTLADLKEIAKQLGVPGSSRLSKSDAVTKILKAQKEG